MPEIIGGEFETDITWNVGMGYILTEGYFYASGRAALYHIMNYVTVQLRYKKIYLPDYLCESIQDIVYRFDIEIVYYPVLSNLEIEWEQLLEKYEQGSVVFLINYFGLITGIDILIHKLKATDGRCCVILDNVQAFFEMFRPSQADFVFTSFRKSLPTPDGAWVKTPFSGLAVCENISEFVQYKMAGAWLKRMREYEEVNDEFYLKLLAHGEKLINKDLSAKMSDYTADILNSLDLSAMGKRRIENYNVLYSYLKEIAILGKPDEGQYPLFFPVLLKDRNKVRCELMANNIYCPVHWPVNEKYTVLPRGGWMYENSLSVIVDQRYGEEEMLRMVRIIKKYL